MNSSHGDQVLRLTLIFANVSLCTTVTFALSHFSWLNFTNQTVSLYSQFTLASIASLASRLSLTLAYPPGSLRGVRRKRSSEAPEILSYFARLCRQIPTQQGVLSFLGFTPCPRPRVRGPTPLLIKLGCLPGPVRGVREKTASKAVSFLVLFCLLFLLVFAQAPAAQHTHTRTEPMKNVCFCPMNSGNFGYSELPLPHSPRKRGVSKIHFCSGLRAQPKQKRMEI